MANQAGIVKSLTGGATVINNITGETRTLHVGDIVYQNEKITTNDSNSKIVITQNDGKDISLIGKDTLTLDQSSTINESFGNETVADISALQQAILNGTDLNALEETAAGGATTGGDGVSLSSVSFTEGGHSSNVNANVGSIDALAIAQGRGNDLGIGTGDNNPAGNAQTLPRTTLSIQSPGEVNESDGYMVYALSLNGVALTSRATTLNFALNGTGNGEAYKPNSLEYFDTATNKWKPIVGGSLTLADANDIDNLQVRVGIDNYGLKDVNTNAVVVAQGNNQNQGTIGESKLDADGNKYSDYGVDYKDYSRNLTLNVTTDNAEIANPGSIEGRVVENDDYINVSGTLNGKTVSTGSGDDTVKINNVIGNNARFFTGSFEEGSDSDIVEVNNSELTRVDYRGGVINTGHTGNDTIKIKSSTIKGASSTFYISTGGTGMNNVTVDANSTLENVHIENQGGGTVDLSGNLKNVRVSVTNTDLYNNGTNHEYKSVVNIHNNMTGDSIDAGYSSIMTGHGTDHINIDKGVTIDRVQFQMNAGDDTLDLKEGVTFKGGNIYLGSVDPSDTSFRLPGMPTPNFPAFTDNDTLNVKAGATLENSKISTQDGTDTINIEKGSTVNNNIIGMGKGIDTININENVSGMTVKMGEDKDTVSIGEGVKVKDSEFYGDSDWYYGSNNGWKNPKGSKDTFNINKDAKLENVTIYGDAKSDEYNTYLSNASYNRIREIVSGDDDINIGEGAKLKNVTIYGDSNFADPAMNNSVRNYSGIEMKGGNDTITIGEGSKLDNVKIYGEVGTDTLKIENATANNIYVDMGTDNDVVEITDSTIKGNNYSSLSKIYGGEGKDNVKIENSNIEYTYIYTDDDNDTVTVGANSTLTNSRIETGDGVIGDSDGARGDKVVVDGGSDTTKATLNKTAIWAGNGEDTVVVKNANLINGSSITTNDGDDNITIGQGAVMTGGSISTGSGTNDTVTINDNANLTNVTINMAIDTDQDKATLDIKDNAMISNLTVEGNTTLGAERTINFHQSGEATVNYIHGIKGKDIIDIKGDVDFIGNLGSGNNVETYGGNDEINIHSGATVKNLKADMGAKVDTVTINNAAIETSDIKTGDGGDIVNINGAQLKGSSIYTEGGNDQVTIENASFNPQVVGSNLHTGDGNDFISLRNVNFGAACIFSAGEGDDTLEIREGVDLRAAMSSLDAGNDTLIVHKGANQQGLNVEGGSGTDTLIVNETIDFSKVKNFEKLRLGGHTEKDANENITTVDDDATVSLTADNVRDILRSSDETVLKIDGKGGDKLQLKTSEFGGSAPTDQGDYMRYESNGTFIDVKKGLDIDWQ